MAEGRIAARFQAVGPGRAILHLKKNPTRREVLHEMVHMRQLAELGFEKYQELRQSGRHEMGVYEWFKEHPEEWNRLNALEQHAEQDNFRRWKAVNDQWELNQQKP